MVTGRVSVIIPGRNETYFKRTVESVLESATGDIEVIAVIDGDEAEPRVESNDPRVKIVRLKKAIGQRAGYNLGVRESSGEYVMKIDAHALLSKGFDIALKKSCRKKTVVLPIMRRLDVKAWKSKDGGHVKFMFPGLDLYCHEWHQFGNRPEGKVEYPEVMTGQGSCWFCRREWNDHIGLLDEKVGSWGNVGIEISLRTWLCGGRQILNPKCWQAHYFRRNVVDPTTGRKGFPYPLNGRDIGRAHSYTWNNYYFKDDAFENQTRPFRWFIDHFSPVPGWEAYEVDMFQAPRYVVYTTDSVVNPVLANGVRKRLKKVVGPIPIISVSQEPCDFGKNIVIGTQPRCYRSIYDSLMRGLQEVPDEAIVYVCEHDVFYHPSHFAFLPPEKNTMYFNINRYYYHLNCDNFAHARGRRAMSQCVGYKEAIVKHCQERIDSIKNDDNGIELSILKWDDWEEQTNVKCVNFESNRPNVDILHDSNFTPRGDWKRKYLRGEITPQHKAVWDLPGWGKPPHFRSSTGYKREKFDDISPDKPMNVANGHKLDAAQFLHNRVRRMLPQVSPIRCRQMKRTKLPEIFAKLGFKVGAEVGVRKGDFSKLICEANPGVKLFCVDPWAAYYHFSQESGNEHYEIAKKALAPYDCTLIRKFGQEAAFDFEDESLDFVYIDGDHRFDWVMEDLITWGRKVRSGGIISGHDYYRFRNSGVVPAVDTYTFQHGIHEWFITDEKEASFFFAKA